MMFDVDILWCPDNLLSPLPCLMLPMLCTRYQCYDTGTSQLSAHPASCSKLSSHIGARIGARVYTQTGHGEQRVLSRVME